MSAIDPAVTYVLERVRASEFTGDALRAYATLCICQYVLAEIDATPGKLSVATLRRRTNALNARLCFAVAAELDK